MNKRFEGAAEKWAKEEFQRVECKHEKAWSPKDAFLAGAQHGYAEGQREMNEECQQALRAVESYARALVADDEEKSNG